LNPGLPKYMEGEKIGRKGDDQNYIMPQKSNNGAVIPVHTMTLYRGK
jgi:hypothetical protein